jgi:hypothetical protein
MSILIIVRTTLLSLLLSFAVGQTSFANPKEGAKAVTKAEAKKTKSEAKAKKALTPAKAKAEKKVTTKQESKPKVKTKSTASKKPTKEPKKLATAETYEKNGGGFPFFTILLVVIGLMVLGAICFAIWLDYRPTVYPSGKVYGTLEYFPSPFTTEINGMQKQKSTPNAAARAEQVAKNAETPHKVNQPAPVTVTREPVNKSQKHPAAKAG